jgi:hypothetical protein
MRDSLEKFRFQNVDIYSQLSECLWTSFLNRQECPHISSSFDVRLFQFLIDKSDDVISDINYGICPQAFLFSSNCLSLISAPSEEWMVSYISDERHKCSSKDASIVFLENSLREISVRTSKLVEDAILSFDHLHAQCFVFNVIFEGCFPSFRAIALPFICVNLEAVVVHLLRSPKFLWNFSSRIRCLFLTHAIFALDGYFRSEYGASDVVIGDDLVSRLLVLFKICYSTAPKNALDRDIVLECLICHVIIAPADVSLKFLLFATKQIETPPSVPRILTHRRNLQLLLQLKLRSFVNSLFVSSL